MKFHGWILQERHTADKKERVNMIFRALHKLCCIKLATSPTLQSPLACNQWQHLLQCRSTTGQYIQKDWRAEQIIHLERWRYMWNKCLKNPNPNQVNILGRRSSPKNVEVIMRQNHRNAMHHFCINRTHFTSLHRETMSITLPTFPLIM